jgi:transcriptional regulator with XRE-family HTH domain
VNLHKINTYYTQNSTKEEGVGKRLRLLRGDLTQDEFSQQIGISRSALANYETGRTKPKQKTLRQICKSVGVSETFFIDGTVSDISELARVFGIDSDQPSGITDDEVAIVRIMRICSSDTVLKIVKALTSEIEDSSEARRLADPLTAITDLERLYTIISMDGIYERGVTQQNLEVLIREIGRQKNNLLEFNNRQKGPQ